MAKAQRSRYCVAGISRSAVNAKGRRRQRCWPRIRRAMFAHDTVEAELRQTARIHGQMERWEEVTEKLQIAPLLPKHPYDISVGERQRAALAKCLLTGAGVLLLDEPTKGMDAFSKHRLAGLLATAKRIGAGCVPCYA